MRAIVCGGSPHCCSCYLCRGWWPGYINVPLFTHMHKLLIEVRSGCCCFQCYTACAFSASSRHKWSPDFLIPRRKNFEIMLKKEETLNLWNPLFCQSRRVLWVSLWVDKHKVSRGKEERSGINQNCHTCQTVRAVTSCSRSGEKPAEPKEEGRKTRVARAWQALWSRDLRYCSCLMPWRKEDKVFFVSQISGNDSQAEI